jgi:hypothetical protein
MVTYYVCASGLAGLILGYIVGRVMDRRKHKWMKTDRNLQLKGRIIAEEKAERIEGKYIVLKSLAKGSDGIG